MASATSVFLCWILASLWFVASVLASLVAWYVPASPPGATVVLPAVTHYTLYSTPLSVLFFPTWLAALALSGPAVANVSPPPFSFFHHIAAYPLYIAFAFLISFLAERHRIRVPLLFLLLLGGGLILTASVTLLSSFETPSPPDPAKTSCLASGGDWQWSECDGHCIPETRAERLRCGGERCLACSDVCIPGYQCRCPAGMWWGSKEEGCIPSPIG